MNIMQNNLIIPNDITAIDKDQVLEKINTSARFSLSFVMLLITSTIICTLGLLMDSAPIVIGGMIMSPLMWQLMQIAEGVSFGRKKLVFKALLLFGLSVAVGLFVAFFITFLSPVKAITGEISALVQPTILDLIIALSAGAIAALAVGKKNISDSLAGVAIATSLAPPLCVSGIGLALSDFSMASGAFLLFLSNVISIIFIAVIVFLLVGVRLKREKAFTFEALSFIGVIFVLLAVQLFVYFQHYSLQTNAHQTAQKVLTESFRDIDHTSVVSNVKTTIGTETDKHAVSIEADVLIPEQVTIDYLQKQKIIERLEKQLNKPIELNVHLERTLAFVSEKEKTASDTQKELSLAFRNAIAMRKESLDIESLDIFQQPSREWVMNATLIGDPDAEFTDMQRTDLEQSLSKSIGQPVALTIDLIPRIKLKSEPDTASQQISQDVKHYLAIKNKDITISSLTVTKKDKDTVEITLVLEVPKAISISSLNIKTLKTTLSKKYNKTFVFTINLIEKRSYTF